MEAKLRSGAKVADIGCGLGASTILMAKAFPKSEFYGFDYHDGSIALAREAAKREGMDERLHFEVASAKDFPGKGYDFVAFFDCLHDMGDPAGAAAYVHSTMTSDGTWMIVEPFAEDATEANLNPIGRMFYSASTLLCVPASHVAGGGRGAGGAGGREADRRSGAVGRIQPFRRATQTPFNLVFEARA